MNMNTRRPKNREFTPIGTLIDQIRRGFRLERGVDPSLLWERWNSIVGPAIADNAQPAVFKGKLLVVHVSSSTWLQQLQFLKADLIEKINTTFGHVLIEDIKFKIGALT
jgi:predicted nucleic acid-binding Zn ribbon protein